MKRWDGISWALLAGHALVLLAFMWVFEPNADGRLERMEGPLYKDAPCKGRGCDYGVYIHKTLLACSHNPIGPVLRCPQDFVEGQSASATYFTMPTLASLVGLSQPSRVIVELRQGERVIHAKDVATYRREHWLGMWILYIMVFVLFNGINQWHLGRKA